MEQLIAAPSTHPSAGTGAAERFELLYRHNRDDVFAYVAGVLRDRSLAEDVTAQAFERAYRKRSTFKASRGSERAWLFGIARNAALDELRRRKRTVALSADPEDLEGGGAEQGAETALRRATLREAIAGLDGHERELIALKFFAGLSNGEIASVLGLSPTNAGTKLHRTIEKLRSACDETT